MNECQLFFIRWYVLAKLDYFFKNKPPSLDTGIQWFSQSSTPPHYCTTTQKYTGDSKVTLKFPKNYKQGGGRLFFL